MYVLIIYTISKFMCMCINMGNIFQLRIYFIFSLFHVPPKSETINVNIMPILLLLCEHCHHYASKSVLHVIYCICGYIPFRVNDQCNFMFLVYLGIHVRNYAFMCHKWLLLNALSFYIHFNGQRTTEYNNLVIGFVTITQLSFTLILFSEKITIYVKHTAKVNLIS